MAQYWSTVVDPTFRPMLDALMLVLTSRLWLASIVFFPVIAGITIGFIKLFRKHGDITSGSYSVKALYNRGFERGLVGLWARRQAERQTRQEARWAQKVLSDDPAAGWVEVNGTRYFQPDFEQRYRVRTGGYKGTYSSDISKRAQDVAADNERYKEKQVLAENKRKYGTTVDLSLWGVNED